MVEGACTMISPEERNRSAVEARRHLLERLRAITGGTELGVTNQAPTRQRASQRTNRSQQSR